MSLEAIGFAIDTVGKVLVAYTAIRVHHRVWQEHKIDDQVFKEMKAEQRLGFLGITMIIVGSLIELQYKL